MPFRCKPCNFYPKNVGILKIHIHVTLGKSHLGSNIAIFIQKTLASKVFTWMPLWVKVICVQNRLCFVLVMVILALPQVRRGNVDRCIFGGLFWRFWLKNPPRSCWHGEKHFYFKMLITFEPKVAQRSVASQNDHKSKACVPEAYDAAFTMYRRLKRRL